MSIIQNEKNCGITLPEFEREFDFLIPVGLILIEFEEVYDKDSRMVCNIIKQAEQNYDN
jgi:hypothetical protein